MSVQGGESRSVADFPSSSCSPSSLKRPCPWECLCRLDSKGGWVGRWWVGRVGGLKDGGLEGWVG